MASNDTYISVMGMAVTSLTTDAIVVLDPKTYRLIEVNQAFTRVFGYTADEAACLTLQAFSAADPESLQTLVREIEERGELSAGVRPYRSKDGRVVPMETRVGVIDIEGRRLHCAVMRDVSELHRAQAAATESEERFRTLAKAAFEGIGITDGGRIIDGNEQLGELLGASTSELLGMSVVDLVAPEWKERLATRFQLGKGEPFEHVMLRLDGSRFEAESQAKLLRIGERVLRVTALRDISQRKRLEEQLQQSQRLESIGRLAGGVAHDFNNLLTVILSLVGMLIEMPRSAEEKEDLLQIQQAAERAAGLTQQLLAFARRRIIEPKVIDLNQLVSDLNRMLKRLLGEQIELVTVCAPDLGTVRVDPGQLEQVLVNLAVNARDAMEAGGTLTIETQNVMFGQEHTTSHPDVTPGDYVMVAITDTGCGMDSSTLMRIFEPFFTTKSSTRGNGLGLATSYGIVKQSGGSLWVYSEPGRGTTFKVYLPRVYEAVSQVQVIAATLPGRGEETLLLVEDDAMVRRVAVRALTDNGYRVVEASTPSEAQLQFAQLEGKIDVLITDVVLPEMSGWKLAQLLRDQNPDLRVLFTSGYTENTIVHHGVVDADIDFLAKPYVLGELARRVREVLARPARKSASKAQG